MGFTLPATVVIPPLVNTGNVITATQMNQVRQAEIDLNANLNAIATGALVAPVTINSSTGTALVTVLNNGNVGIGIVNPGAPLAVYTATPGIQVATFTNASASGANYGIQVNATGVGGSINHGLFVQASGATTNYGIVIPAPAVGANNWAIYANGGAASYFAGRVGLGVLGPGAQLHVTTATPDIPVIKSVTTAVSGNNYGIQITAVVGAGAATSTGVYIDAGGANSNIGLRILSPAAATNNWAIYADCAARSFFQGQVGIGPGTSPSGLTSQLAVIAPTASMTAISGYSPAGGGTGVAGYGTASSPASENVGLRAFADNGLYNIGIRVMSPAAAGANNYAFISDSPAKAVFTGVILAGYMQTNGAYPVQSNGQIFATSGVIATSDGRYKENVQPLTGALDLVNALRPVSFDWKKHPVHNFDLDTPTLGFIGQEVQAALADQPYMRSVVKVNQCEYEDESGAKVTEEFYGLAETNLIALLTRAVQELTARVAALETRQ